MHYSERILGYVKRAEQATQSAKERALREFGLTPAQQTAMAILSDHEGITGAQLARECDVTPQTMNSTLVRLERRGIVERTPHPMHGTLVEIRLTRAGRNLFAAADARVAELDAALSKSLDDVELGTLKELLTRIGATAKDQ
ncbi:MarR family winged helix-turn-helix transcriptional regulator [Paractinoplanes toevensis]|uniref:HTH marR-type domain-containing protein n=1 Tax=Paractinoplanes toevensis TaxID=571911 RepID=A0A919TDJ7_9ACTN|nr:MarR family transcriptional regulator [Actinoplanes toevensis]GIM92204.1 hypothetical protein Ato02nite_039970 [Actinoplanes toevensis]